MLIRYIQHADIDRQLYNSCVHFALNGRAWGYKWYLDATARSFDVLVEGEYESVMPLVWEKNWLGRKRVYTPVLTPALGLFSVHVLSPKRLGYFVREVAARFDAIDLRFTGESSRVEQPEWNWSSSGNLILDLQDKSYEELVAGFDSDLLRTLHKANEAKLLVHANVKPERIAAFAAEHLPQGQRLQHPMLRVLYNAMHRGWGWTSAVTTPDGEMLAAAAFVFTHNRIARVLDIESPFGKTLGAKALLYDYALRQAAGRPVKFDFASDHSPEFAVFGAKPETIWRAHKSSKLLGVIPI